MRSVSVAGALAVSIALLPGAAPAGRCGAAAAQASGTSDTSGAVRFPPRAKYKHPKRVQQGYDRLSDATKLGLELGSVNVFSLLTSPAAKLELEASYAGATPQAAPESVAVVARVYRLKFGFERSQPATAAPALTAAAFPAPPPTMLQFLVDAERGRGSPSPAGAPWRANLSAAPGGSRTFLTADSSGIHFVGPKWLEVVSLVADMAKKPEEAAITLLAHSDSGQLGIERLPERLQKLLRGGLVIRLTEETHRVSLPLDALLQLASAPKVVEARLGQVGFKIRGDDLDALRDFASRLAPATAPEGAPSTPPTPPATGAATGT